MSKHERRFDPKGLHKLESPERKLQFPVEPILNAAGICGTLNVADIGAGSGYLTLPIARRVHPGIVYAVDPSSDLLDVLRGKLALAGAPKNVKVVVGEDSATGLPKASCDLIFLSAVWHEIDDHAAALREFSRIAAPDAKLAIVDWAPEATPPAPPPEIRIAPAEVERVLESAGWGVVKSDLVTSSAYIVVGHR